MSKAVADLRAVRNADPVMALGISVNLLMGKKSFAGLKFNHWCSVLAGQIKREHYFFVLDGDKARGIAGWALTSRELAEDWVQGKGELPYDKCLAGPCLVLNIWQADNARVHQFMREQMRIIGQDKEMLFAKRTYADGRIRPVRLTVNEFVGDHIKKNN